MVLNITLTLQQLFTPKIIQRRRLEDSKCSDRNSQAPRNVIEGSAVLLITYQGDFLVQSEENPMPEWIERVERNALYLAQLAEGEAVYQNRHLECRG